MGLMTAQISSYQYVFPVISGELDEDNAVVDGSILGTCFALAETLFLTAGHVALGVQERGNGLVGIVPAGERTLNGINIEQVELLPYDLALLRCTYQSAPEGAIRPFRWRKDAGSQF